MNRQPTEQGLKTAALGVSYVPAGYNECVIPFTVTAYEHTAMTKIFHPRLGCFQFG
jgi:hypothetical protein